MIRLVLFRSWVLCYSAIFIMHHGCIYTIDIILYISEQLNVDKITRTVPCEHHPDSEAWWW